jgi:NAD(P)H-dependent FMN reductase
MLRIAILTGSTRPGRNSKAIADRVYNLTKQREDAEFELVDLAEQELPIFDEPEHPSRGQYTNPTQNIGRGRGPSFDGQAVLGR